MISRIVLGTWPLSGDYGNVSLSQVDKTLEAAHDAGIREFDVAPNYGNGFMEFALGKHFSGKSLKVNTKFGNLPFRGKSFDLADMDRSIDESLKRLNQAAINVLFLHNPRDDFMAGDKELAFLESVKTSGRAKKIGLSRAKSHQYPDELMSVVDAIQDDCNVLTGLPESSQKNHAFYARSPLANGLLAGKISRKSEFSPDDHRSGWLRGERLDSLLKRVEKLSSCFPDLDLIEIAIKFVFSEPGCERVIFGCKSPKHVQSLTKYSCLKQFQSSEMKMIHDLQKSDFGLIDEQHLNF